MDPDSLRQIRAVIPDLNGIARAKRMPASALPKLMAGQAKMPLSALNLDILGNDIADSPLLFDTGDADGFLRPTPRGLLPMPWVGPEAAMLPMAMYHEDGTPFAGDARHALATVIDRLAARGLTTVTATELEFYLVDLRNGNVQPPADPVTGWRDWGAATLSMQALDSVNPFFDALYAGCAALGIDADTATSEAGPGQFEINLNHGTDPMRMADDTWLFKLLTRGLARVHGLTASFMAKPYPDASGSGLHVHASLLDREGRNIFDDGTPRGSDGLRHAIGGVLATMADATLVFAPHANSYERLVPDAHAPTGIGWAYENRTASVRVPNGPNAARRLEHRVPGGDTNPYLVLTAILGGMELGLADGIVPPPALTGNAYAQDLPQIPSAWGDAVTGFAESDLMARLFPASLIDNFTRTKRQEIAAFAQTAPQDLLAMYLDSL